MKKLLFLACMAASLWAAYDYTRPVEKYVVKATVNAGDTMWDIVGDEMQKAGDRRSIQKVIYETSRISGVHGRALQVGDVLLIPIEVKR